MWAALASIGLMLGISEAERLIDEGFRSDDVKIQNLASQILSRAASKGDQMIRKATQAIENIPMLASSPMITKKLREMRNNAQNSLTRVEESVGKMKEGAEKVANDINSEANRSTLGKIFNRNVKDIERRADDTLKTIDNFEIKEGEQNV